MVTFQFLKEKKVLLSKKRLIGNILCLILDHVLTPVCFDESKVLLRSELFFPMLSKGSAVYQ